MDLLSSEAQEKIMAHGGLSMAKMGGGAYTAVGEEIRASIIDEGRIEIVKYSDQQIDQLAKAAKSVHQAWIDATPNGQVVYNAAVAALSEMRR